MEDRRVLYLGGFTALTNLYTGQKIYVDTRDVSIGAHLMWEGRWEPWIECHIMPHVKPGGHVCDVGANFGFYTLRFASEVGLGGKVYAFEANPHIFSFLRKSVLVNGLDKIVDLHNIALADREGELKFAFDFELSGGGSLIYAEQSQKVLVRADTLDRLLPFPEKISLLKIDVEGAEPLVIRGAQRLLDGSPLKTVLMEFFPTAIAASENPADFIDKFLARGFSISLVRPEGLTSISSGADAVEKVGQGPSYVLMTRS